MESELILASTSPYRRALLERLGLPFHCEKPRVEETPAPGEQAEALALRLSEAKAAAVAARRPRALVIGSDQVADLAGRLLGKPGHAVGACAQLRASSGRRLTFHTGVALLRGQQVLATRCVQTRVQFRELSDDDIESYVAREQPFDCAGSFRWEGLGIVLFEGLHSDDPTALEGLPLIALSQMLRDAGLNPLAGSR